LIGALRRVWAYALGLWAPFSSRSLDWALGLSAWAWVAHAAVTGQVRSIVGATVVAVNALAGALFILRRPASRKATLRESAICLGSAASGALALGVAPPPALWPPLSAALYAIAGAGAAVSLGFLGRSFGVLPAWRGLVRSGPYRIVRHPVYAAELVMLAACAWASRSLGGLGALGLGIALVVVRIRIEERLLAQSEPYQAYAKLVRARLLPGLW